jgi:hypothetical protein
VSAVSTPEPYVAPRPFDREDYGRFFGRDREAADLFSLVLAHPVVLIDIAIREAPPWAKPSTLDTRGVARACTGELHEAADDLEEYIRWARDNPEREKTREQRERWVCGAAQRAQSDRQEDSRRPANRRPSVGDGPITQVDVCLWFDRLAKFSRRLSDGLLCVLAARIARGEQRIRRRERVFEKRSRSTLGGVCG